MADANHKLRAGMRLNLAIRDLDAEGAGVATFESSLGGAMDIHVAGALPGEVVAGEIEHVSPHRREGRGRAFARLISIKVASADRVRPHCPAAGRCGGCPVQHLAVPQQQIWKRNLVARELASVPGLTVAPSACLASPCTEGYRNQSKLVYGYDAEGRATLGAYAPRSHEVVDVSGCALVEPPLDAVAASLRRAILKHGLLPYDPAPYDPAQGSGDLRYAILRSNARGQVLLTLVVPGFDGRARVLARPQEPLLGSHPEIVGIVFNLNRDPGDALFGAEEQVAWGQGTLDDEVGSIAVRLSSRAFFQINRHVAGRIYARIAERVRAHGPVARVVDAYAGVGIIARMLAFCAREVVAIEVNPAVADAYETAQVRFVQADSAPGLATLDQANVIVLNPPRAGCASEVLDQVARLRPALVVYVSCNPRSLARDLGALVRAGFSVEAIEPHDMLPHTAHVETLVVLTSDAVEHRGDLE